MMVSSFFWNKIRRNLIKISFIGSVMIEHNPIFPSIPEYIKQIYLEFWSSLDLAWVEVTESSHAQIYIYKCTLDLQKS